MPSNNPDIFDAAGQEWNVDPNILRSIAAQESGGQPNPDTAVSSAGAMGRMGLMPGTASDLGVTDPSQAAQNVYGAAKYFSQMLDRYGSPALALAAYNAGPGKIDAHLAGSAPLPDETAAYVPAVAAHYKTLTAKAAPASDAFTQAQAAPDPFTAAQTEVETPPSSAPSGAPDPFTAAQAGATADGTAAVEQPAIGEKISAGIGRAIHDVTDIPAQYLAQGADKIGLTALLNNAGITAPNAADTISGDQAALANYDQKFGDSTIANAARTGTQIAATIPVIASGGGALGAVGDVLSAGAGRVAPWLGDAISGVQSFLGGASGNSLAGRGASLAANGALQGGAAGALTAGKSTDSIGTQAAQGGVTGAIAGPVVGGILGAGQTALGLSGGVSPEVARLAQLARDTYGIPITAPQMSTNSLARIASDQAGKLPFSGAGFAAEAQQQAWQRAVSNTFGENSATITPDVMNQAARRIGGIFNNVAARTNVAVDPPLLTTLGQIEQEAHIAPLGVNGTNAISSQIDNIMHAAASGNGTISGDAYQQLIRAGSPLQRAQKAADPNVRFYANQVRDALDDAFQRSAAPEDQAALTNARFQYRNMKTVEDLAEKSPDGNLSPALLMGQVRAASSRFDPSTGGIAYTGGGPLGDLARIGQQFMKQQPNSGTPDRLLVNSMLGIGEANPLFHAASDPLSAMAIPAGLAANRLAGNYLRSGGLARRVINSSLNPQANPLAARLTPLASPISALALSNPDVASLVRSQNNPLAAQ